MGEYNAKIQQVTYSTGKLVSRFFFIK